MMTAAYGTAEAVPLQSEMPRATGDDSPDVAAIAGRAYRTHRPQEAQPVANLEDHGAIRPGADQPTQEEARPPSALSACRRSHGAEGLNRRGFVSRPYAMGSSPSRVIRLTDVRTGTLRGMLNFVGTRRKTLWYYSIQLQYVHGRCFGRKTRIARSRR